MSLYRRHITFSRRRCIMNNNAEIKFLVSGERFYRLPVFQYPFGLVESRARVAIFASLF